MFQAKEENDHVILTDDAAKSVAEIAPARGAIVTKLAVAGRDVLYMDEATLADPSKNVRGGIPLLFPTPGKLEGDRWEHAGKSGSMKQHGFARDMPFAVTKLSAADAATATLSLVSNSRTLGMYPWPFTFTMVVTLVGATLTLKTTVVNTGPTAMPFGFGTHPYFLVRDKAAARISTKATRAFDNVTKKTGPFGGFDLTQKEVDLHLLDHGGTESTLDTGDGHKLTIRGSSEFTRWVVWTQAGKDFVCVEPWTSPGNALNTNDGLLALAPNAKKELTLSFEVS